MIDFSQQPRYLQWANRRLGTNFTNDAAVSLTSLDQDGSILGVVIFSRFTPWGCELSTVFDDKRGVTPRLLKAAFIYAFIQCGLSRISVFVAADNEKSLNHAQRLGFRKEGVARAWYGDRDAHLLGLLRQDCKWLKDSHGQPFSAAST